jgi:hypothetical protein
MAQRNPYYDQSVYIAETRARNRLDDEEKQSTIPFYRKLALAKDSTYSASINELPPNADINAYRTAISKELNGFIKDQQQISNIIQYLTSSDDLKNYYRFGKLFETSIRGIRALDSNYFIQLWDKFKEKLLTSDAKAKKQLDKIKATEGPKPTEINLEAYKQMAERKGMAAEDINRSLRKHPFKSEISNESKYRGTINLSNLYEPMGFDKFGNSTITPATSIMSEMDIPDPNDIRFAGRPKGSKNKKKKRVMI